MSFKKQIFHLYEEAVRNCQEHLGREQRTFEMLL